MRRARSNTVVSDSRRNAKHRRVNPELSQNGSLRASGAISSLASTLPLDVLRIIMSFVPLHPRLRVVSLVCRRWRTAALQSVDHLHTSRPNSAATALRFLPFVTSLSLCTVSAELRVPTGLRVLRLFEPPRRPPRHNSVCTCQHFSHLTTLTDISLTFHGTCNCVFSILTANQSSLRSLTLHMGGSVISKETTARFASLASLCETLTFPSLSSLTLSVPGFTSEAMGRVYKALLSRNRERLTALDAVVGRTINLAVDRILSIGFSNLTDCTISAATVSKELAALILRGMPKLRNLALFPDYEGGMDLGALGELAHVLTSLQVAIPGIIPRGPQYDAWMSEFCSCTRVSKLILRHLETPVWRSVATQLTTLQVAPLQRDFARLRACTALRVLDVYVPTGLTSPAFEFPLLTNLYVGFEAPLPLAKVVSIFRSVITSCPLLRVLSLELPPMPKPPLRPLEAVIAEAERRGLEQLCLCVHDSATHAQLRQLNARFQWLEIEVALPLQDGPQILEITDLDIG